MSTLPSADRAPDAPPVGRLLAEAAEASDVVWVCLPDGSSHLAWHAWDGTDVLLISGPGEQTLPPLPGEVEIVLRSPATRAALVRAPARVRSIGAEDARWGEAATALRAARLNAPAGEVLPRWRAGCTVYALSPDLTRAARH